MSDAVPRHARGDAPGVGAIERRVLGGIFRLALREAAIKVVALAGSITLARLLDPVAFGLYGIAHFVVNLFGLFSELGLGAALIRKQGGVSPRELSAIFTFQLLWVCVLALGLFLVAPLVAAAYGAPDVLWLVRALAFSLVLTSLRSAPVILTERRLAYGPVALADVVGQVTYWIVAVGGASAGLGTWSLVAAVLASAAAGTTAIYSRVRWRPALALDWRPVREVARFGLLFQGQSAASFLKDTMTSSLGGLLYGGVAVGYLSWAQQLAVAPLLLTFLVARVSYPAWAKLQGQTEAFTAAVASTLRWTCRVSLPAFAVLVGLAPQIIEYVYGSKWLPALPSLYALCASMVLGVGTSLLVPALYSSGRATTALCIMTGWTALTWLLALGLAAGGMGFEGLAIGTAVGTAVALGAVLVAVRSLSLDVLRLVRVPLLSGLGCAVVLHLTAPAAVHGPMSLMAAAAAGGLGTLAINLWGDYSTAWAALTSGLRDDSP